MLYIAGRQIIEAALVANVVVEDIRRLKCQSLVVKMDFEKAFDMGDS